ncbi:hypothetical protein ACF082_34675 [Streptomyces lydicus]|uniref:hypothetical protein n=1 Tax=Streptomyces lydicus TaxID=47763 RepID=UPI0036F5BB9C
MFVRRGIGLAIALGVAYGIFHVIFRAEVLARVLAYVGPVKDFIGWVVEDPGRAWIVLAALVIPHIGLYYLLFEDREVGRGGMFKSARLIIALSLIGGISLAAVIGWVTGFFGSSASIVGGLWNDFMDWINSPLGWEHLLAGAGVLFVPVIVLILIFAIADG